MGNIQLGAIDCTVNRFGGAVKSDRY